MTDKERKEFLTNRAIRFFDRYGDELGSISKMLEIKLSQLALAYTIQNKLPKESVRITSRVKTLKSFLKKLERKDWPEYYYPTEIAYDLIGTRVICWFLDDVYGLLQYIKESKQFRVKHDSIRDYIKNPKPSGYRSVHLLADVPYDKIKNENGVLDVKDDHMLCEIQIRTKLQDAWGDLTHEFHYKAKDMGLEEQNYDKMLSQGAKRLSNEDESFIIIREMYQKLIEDKVGREGFTDSEKL